MANGSSVPELKSTVRRPYGSYSYRSASTPDASTTPSTFQFASQHAQYGTSHVLWPGRVGVDAGLHQLVDVLPAPHELLDRQPAAVPLLDHAVGVQVVVVRAVPLPGADHRLADPPPLGIVR